MPAKKKDEKELEEVVKAEASEEKAEKPAKAKAADAETAEEKPKKAKAEPKAEAKAEAKPAKKEAKPKAAKAAKADGDKSTAASRGNRAQRIGVVSSDKMTKTVVVRVDRLVKHPKYRRYVRRKKQFMAHDELGATIGDKVKIVETRPLSARKRWRVVEIVQKAAK